MNKYKYLIALFIVITSVSTHAEEQGYSDETDYNPAIFIRFLKGNGRITIPPPEIVCPIGLHCLTPPKLENSDWTKTK